MINLINQIGVTALNCKVSTKQKQNFVSKPDTVSFTSKNLLVKKSSEISKEILSAIEKKKNFMGEGSEGAVYRIGNSGYCVKILRKNKEKPLGYWNLNISPKDRVNHIVAKDEYDNIIMRTVKGVPLSELDYRRSKLDSLPKESYRKVLKQINDAHKLSMEYDGYPANIIYNPKDKTLTSIDFFKAQDIDEYTPFASLYRTLRCNPIIPGDKYDKKLAGNFLNIALDEVEKGKNADIPVEYEDMTELFRNIECSTSQRVHYSEVFPPQYDYLKGSINNILNLKKLQNRGIDVDKDIRGEVKYSRCIVNQIFGQSK